ncbi:hypothetical protein ACFV1L_29080 [Kitasatospora sp. NPDC059646]|uniref:hypothetical protein n=1 Tax=Kitasatospora sp. NPDC059646 TaxID=3346893 RepID=UPI003677909B
MTPEELAALLTGERTPAFGPAREALLSGGSCGVRAFLGTGSHHAGIVRARLRTALRKGRPALGFAETVEILRAAGDRPTRVGWIRSADGRWYFQVFLDATAGTVLACLRSGPLDGRAPADPESWAAGT